jgi:hypothetical protein
MPFKPACVNLAAKSLKKTYFFLQKKEKNNNNTKT